MILPPTGFSLDPDSKFRHASVLLTANKTTLAIRPAHGALFLVPWARNLEILNFKCTPPRCQPIYFGPLSDPRPLSQGWSKWREGDGSLGYYFSEANDFGISGMPEADCLMCEGKGVHWNQNSHFKLIRQHTPCKGCIQVRILRWKWFIVGRCRETGFEWIRICEKTREKARWSRKNVTRKNNEYATYHIVRAKKWLETTGTTSRRGTVKTA